MLRLAVKLRAHLPQYGPGLGSYRLFLVQMLHQLNAVRIVNTARQAQRYICHYPATQKLVASNKSLLKM
jgi:hypothetical protein